MVHVKFTVYIEYNLVRSFQTSLFLQKSLLDQCLAVVWTRPNKVKVLSDLETVDIYHEGFVHNLKEGIRKKPFIWNTWYNLVCFSFLSVLVSEILFPTSFCPICVKFFWLRCVRKGSFSHQINNKQKLLYVNIIQYVLFCQISKSPFVILVYFDN